MVVLVERAMQWDAVGLEKQVLQRVDASEAQRLVDAVGQVGIVEDDVEAERLCPQGHGASNAAQSDQAQGVAADACTALLRENEQMVSSS